jgi:hypothetical protein
LGLKKDNIIERTIIIMYPFDISLFITPEIPYIMRTKTPNINPPCIFAHRSIIIGIKIKGMSFLLSRYVIKYIRTEKNKNENN